MADLLRDTGFGQIARLLSGNKLFPFPDEVNPSLWKNFASRATSSSLPPQSSHSEKGESEKSHDVESAAQQQPTPDENHSHPLADTGNGEDQDVFLVNWYDADDPENPQNWPSSTKNTVSLLMYMLNFSVYLASSIYVPGLESIMEEFGSSQVVATLGLSLYTIGYGLGPMLWAPMSELPQLGRSNLYLWTLLVFCLLSLGAGFAVNMPMFLVFRLIQGFFGGPSLINAAATIGDMYDPARTAYGVCIWAAWAVCGPVFGPIIGGFAAPAMGWRWTIWIYTWLCAFCTVLLFFLLPETNAANILYRRAKRLRKNTGNDKLRSQSEIDAAGHTLRDRFSLLGRAFYLLFTEPIVFVMDTFTALVYGVLFIWFESFPLVFGEIYGFSIQMQGLAYLGMFVGLLIVVPGYLLWVKYGVIPAFMKPNFKPEMMLPPTFVGSMALPVCLFWYGWTSRESVHWIVPIIGTSFFTIGVITVFNAVFNYLGVAYHPYSASVFAGNTLFRSSFGGAFPLFARALFTKLGIGPGNSLLGAVATLFVPIAFGLYKYGDRIRHRSRNARHDI